MIKEAIDRILQLAGPKTVEIEGHTYADSRLQRIEEPLKGALDLRSLTAFCDFVKRNLPVTSYVVVESPTKVVAYSDESDDLVREQLAECSPAWRAEFVEGKRYDQEGLIMMLQTQFDHQAAPVTELIERISSVRSENTTVDTDDGTTQTVQAKAGIVLAETVALPSALMLAPYRSFPDLEAQIVSSFVLRAHREPAGVTFTLTEADGGRWLLAAMAAIAQVVREQLPTVTVLA